jgi:outer membrane protein assembly factor BamB
MGLRVAIAVAILGGLVLIGVIAFFIVPSRRGPRLALGATLITALVLALIALVLAPLSPLGMSPASKKLSVYFTGQVCDTSPFARDQTCASGLMGLNDLHASDGTLRWDAKADRSNGNQNSVYYGAPALHDRVIYTVRGPAPPNDTAATLFALQATDGSEIWRAPVDAKPLRITVQDGQILMLLKYREDQSHMLVLSASDGRVIQKLTLPLVTSFFIADGLLIGCASYPDAARSVWLFAAWRLNDGAQVWSDSTPLGIPNNPNTPTNILACSLDVAGGIVYAAPIAGGLVTAARIADGGRVWERRLDFVGAIAVSASRLIAATAPTVYTMKQSHSGAQIERALALDLATGQTVWERSLPAGLPDGPGSNVFLTISGDMAYVAAAKHLRAFRVTDGALLWQASDKGGASYFDPVVEQGTLYVSYAYEFAGPRQELQEPAQGQIRALDASTGSLFWSVQVLSSGFSVGEV